MSMLRSKIIRLSDFFCEWKIRLRYYWIYRKKIIMKNNGIIQWDDLTIIYRPHWPNYYTIEQMEEFRKDIK